MDETAKQPTPEVVTFRRRLGRIFWWVPVVLVSSMFVYAGYWSLHTGNTDRLFIIPCLALPVIMTVSYVSKSAMLYNEPG